MSEPAGAPETPPAVKEKKKRKVSHTIALAILEVIERKKLDYQVNMRAIGAKYGMKPGNLRRTWFEYVHGGVDLGPVGKPMEATMGDRENHELAREVIRRDLALTLRLYSGALYTAEDTAVAKKLEVKKVPLRKNANPAGSASIMDDLAYFRRALEQLLRLQHVVDEGYNSFLSELESRSRPVEKLANPGVPIPPATQAAINGADERSRILEQLRLDAAGNVIDEAAPVPVK